MKKHAILIALGLVVVLLFVGDAARFYRFGFVQFIDAKLYDYRMRLTMPETADDRIVILDIDEKSLKEDGRWPWGRDKMAMLTETLFERYGVAVVGFDVVELCPIKGSIHSDFTAAKLVYRLMGYLAG